MSLHCICNECRFFRSASVSNLRRSSSCCNLSLNSSSASDKAMCQRLPIAVAPRRSRATGQTLSCFRCARPPTPLLLDFSACHAVPALCPIVVLCEGVLSCPLGITELSEPVSVDIYLHPYPYTSTKATHTHSCNAAEVRSRDAVLTTWPVCSPSGICS